MKEPLIGFSRTYRYFIKLGVPLVKAFTSGCEKYATRYRMRLDNQKKTIYISFTSDAVTEDIVEASIAASIVNNIIHAALFCDKKGTENIIEDVKLRKASHLLNCPENFEAEIVQIVHEYMANKKIMLINRLKHAGYDLSAIHFAVDSWRHKKQNLKKRQGKNS